MLLSEDKTSKTPEDIFRIQLEVNKIMMWGIDELKQAVQELEKRMTKLERRL
jgi:hypothetical protein